jgi:hypothetical protein
MVYDRSVSVCLFFSLWPFGVEKVRFELVLEVKSSEKPCLKIDILVGFESIASAMSLSASDIG